MPREDARTNLKTCQDWQYPRPKTTPTFVHDHSFTRLTFSLGSNQLGVVPFGEDLAVWRGSDRREHDPLPSLPPFSTLARYLHAVPHSNSIKKSQCRSFSFATWNHVVRAMTKMESEKVDPPTSPFADQNTASPGPDDAPSSGFFTRLDRRIRIKDSTALSNVDLAPSPPDRWTWSAPLLPPFHFSILTKSSLQVSMVLLLLLVVRIFCRLHLVHGLLRRRYRVDRPGRPARRPVRQRDLGGLGLFERVRCGKVSSRSRFLRCLVCVCKVLMWRIVSGLGEVELGCQIALLRRRHPWHPRHHLGCVLLPYSTTTSSYLLSTPGGVQMYFQGQFISLILSTLIPSFYRLPNTLPPSAQITTKDLISYVLAFLFTLPFMFVPTWKIYPLFQIKAVVMPLAGMGIVVWAVKANGGVSAGVVEDTALRGSNAMYAWGILSQMNSSASLSVSIPWRKLTHSLPCSLWRQLRPFGDRPRPRAACQDAPFPSARSTARSAFSSDTMRWVRRHRDRATIFIFVSFAVKC